jgi:hypothetical protein
LSVAIRTDPVRAAVFGAYAVLAQPARCARATTKTLIFPQTDAIARKRNVLSGALPGPFGSEMSDGLSPARGHYHHNIFMAFLFAAGLATDFPSATRFAILAAVTSAHDG